MNMEPSATAIETVKGFLNVSKEEARRKLKAHSNDVERAINAHYESATQPESQV
ncbi:MAG: hypothetical protein M1812_002295 [Candelaria pacifica]|nr:MAG: hypothetical protein M1812_002295 [Candelaria pacifica]